MDRIDKYFGAFIALGAASALAIGISGVGKPNLVEVEGTVINETYMPASEDTPSRYSFSLDVKGDPKGIQVSPCERLFEGNINIESIDALIKEGTKVKVTIDEDEINELIYHVPASRINVPKAANKQF